MRNGNILKMASATDFVYTRAQLGANADPELWTYLDTLSKVDPAALDRNPAERLAFLLNVPPF